MDAFLRNPELVWSWYAHRKRLIADVQPNAGHVALARFETLVESFVVITQNIDNLHRRAGSRHVVELHGNIERNYCIRCGTPASNAEVLAADSVPVCRSCGGVVRPDVVWFGEPLPEDEWNAAVRATESADVFLSVGTSGIVYPAASLPGLARRSGAYCVEINTEPTVLTPSVDEYIEGASGSVLPLLAEVLEKR